MAGEVEEDFRVQHVSRDILVADVLSISAKGFSQLFADLVEIDWRQRRTRTFRQRCFAAEHFGLQLFGETANRLTQITAEEGYDGIRESHFLFRVNDVFGCQVVRHHEQRHVANNFGRRRDLDDVSEQLIHFGIALHHFRPAVLDAQAPRLLAQVGVLSARHCVLEYI